MASPHAPIVIDEDDDSVSSPDSHRSRSLPVISSSSSCTMRANSSKPEVAVVPKLDRLSIQTTPPTEPFRPQTKVKDHVSDANRRKRDSSSVKDEEYAPRPTRRPFGSHRRRNRQSPEDAPPLRDVIDLEDEEEVAEVRRYNKDEDQIIDVDELELKLEEEIFQEPQPPRGRKSSQRIPVPGPRNTLIVLPFVELDVYRHNDASLKKEKTVELKDGSFLKITSIMQNLETDEVSVRGWKLKRAREMDGIVPKKINEVTFIFEVDLDDGRDCRDQSIMEVEVKEVRRIRHLICTNRPFPECRFDQKFLQGNRKKDVVDYIENKEVLVARWKMTTKFGTERDRLENPNKLNNFCRRQLELVSNEECSRPEYSMEASLRRLLSRGETTLGGSGTERVKVKPESRAGYANKSRVRQTFISLLDDDKHDNSNKKSHTSSRQPVKPTPMLKRVYTYGDTFSGGGGSIRGAFMAGLKLKYGLDFNTYGCATLRANFPGVDVYEMWANEFAALPDPLHKFYVDILHLSPPCQVFSPAHARPGKDDEMNFASLFAIEELIKKTKPRMVTLEQTFGILFHRFSYALNSLIRMFTDNGYSTAWQVVEFHKYGLPQRRKRLIIVAAGPGETLPELPAYTHNELGSGGLEKYVSVRNVLDSIPRNASQHDKAAAYGRAKYHAWDDSSIINCITTNGGDYSCHPSGERGLTPREYAALQGFPHEHFFIGNCVGVIKRQIGNAVPPLFANILFRSLRKNLEQADAEEQEVSIKGA